MTCALRDRPRCAPAPLTASPRRAPGRTGHRQASHLPYDRVWGIGLTANHEDATDPERWRGTNLLGFALMEVRDRLRAADS